jgi:SAM-dependent methyltransferase
VAPQTILPSSAPLFTPASKPADNQGAFAESEFSLWSYREGLERGEKFLIENYLRKDGETLEAGSGGGRILLELQNRGFTRLHGFDYLPSFVEIAQTRDRLGTIEYRVENAISLDYQDNSFDQELYLQQVLCFLESEDHRHRAVREAFRVLRPGGRVIVSLLSYRARAQAWSYRPMPAYLYCLRKLTLRARGIQYWPWLRRNGMINLSAFLDRGPYLYWMHEREAVELFTDAGFQVEQLGSDAQVAQGQLLDSVDALENAPLEGRLYLICRKPRLI